MTDEKIKVRREEKGEELERSQNMRGREDLCFNMPQHEGETGASLQPVSENKKNIITLKRFWPNECTILQLYSDLDKCPLSRLLLNTRETGRSLCQAKLIKARQMCLDSGVPHTHTHTMLHTCSLVWTLTHMHADTHTHNL